MTYHVEKLVAPHISDEDATQLIVLVCSVYPERKPREQTLLEDFRRAWRGYCGPPEMATQRFIIRQNNRIIANATILPRWISTATGRLKIAGLCGVASHPDVRGLGYGKAVTRAAFDAVDAGEFDFALFQTGEARGFYDLLGCAIVNNEIINSLNEEAPRSNPFRDEFVMRYPAGGDWPGGEIDLLGNGY
jgi:GNAT superfamily N-acetyltransferase